MYYSRMKEAYERRSQQGPVPNDRGSDYFKLRIALVIAATLGLVLGSADVLPQAPAYLASAAGLIIAHAGFTR